MDWGNKTIRQLERSGIKHEVLDYDEVVFKKEGNERLRITPNKGGAVIKIINMGMVSYTVSGKEKSI